MALHGGLSFCKTQQVVGFDCAGIERLSVPQPNTDTPCYRNVLNPRGAVQLLETHGHSTRQKTCPTFQASFREYKLRGRVVKSYFVAIFER